MTVVLVAFKGAAEGSKKNTLAPLVCQSGARGRQAREQADPQALSLYSNVDLDADGSEVPLLHSPSHLFSPFVSFPPSDASLPPPPVSFISLLSLFLSPCLSFSHPSEVVA